MFTELADRLKARFLHSPTVTPPLGEVQLGASVIDVSHREPGDWCYVCVPSPSRACAKLAREAPPSHFPAIETTGSAPATTHARFMNCLRLFARNDPSLIAYLQAVRREPATISFKTPSRVLLDILDVKEIVSNLYTHGGLNR